MVADALLEGQKLASNRRKSLKVVLNKFLWLDAAAVRPCLWGVPRPAGGGGGGGGALLFRIHRFACALHELSAATQVQSFQVVLWTTSEQQQTALRMPSWAGPLLSLPVRALLTVLGRLACKSLSKSLSKTLTGQQQVMCAPNDTIQFRCAIRACWLNAIACARCLCSMCHTSLLAECKKDVKSIDQRTTSQATSS